MEHFFEGGAENGFGHFAFAFFTAASIKDARSPRSQAALISSSGIPATRHNRKKDAYAWPELFQRAISVSEGSAYWRCSASAEWRNTLRSREELNRRRPFLTDSHV